MNMSAIVEKVQPLIVPIIEEMNCELVDIEYVKEGKNWYLRLYVDQPSGMDLDTCAAISERVSECLDQIEPDPFPAAYFLEVSSPGAERPLKTAEQIAAAVGEYVHFDYYTPQYGSKSHEGELLEVEAESYLLKVQDKTVTKQLTIDKANVAKARLAIKF